MLTDTDFDMLCSKLYAAQKNNSLCWGICCIQSVNAYNITISRDFRNSS